MEISEKSLNYPDNLPLDPLIAESEVYVEVASEDGSTDRFDFTNALTICTITFLKENLRSQPHYASRSVVVVERFTDDVISQALEALLPDIKNFAIKK